MKVEVWVEGETVLLEVKGELDAVSVPAFLPVVEELLARPHRRWVVDLSALRMIDSNGVRAIAQALRKIDERGGSVLVEAPTGQPLSILRLLRLDHMLGETISLSRRGKDDVAMPAMVPLPPVPAAGPIPTGSLLDPPSAE